MYVYTVFRPMCMCKKKLENLVTGSDAEEIRKPTVTRLLKHTDCLSSVIFFTTLASQFSCLCENKSETWRERCLFLAELSQIAVGVKTALKLHLLNRLSAVYRQA